MLAAVHYGELSESPAQQVVRYLVDSELVHEFIEVVDQPQIPEPVDTTELSSWRLLQSNLECQWRNYLLNPSPLRDVVTKMNEKIYRSRLHLSQAFRNREWHTRQIEKYVTAKHIQAWKVFLESSHSALVVVESDAVLVAESHNQLWRALAQLDVDGATYVNLSGGLAPKDIGIMHLADGKQDGFTLFSRPVTNTSCVYGVNRRLIAEILLFLETSPDFGNLGIDWLLNAFFINQSHRSLEIRCLHAQPPAMLHGSLSGVTQSWHPHR